MPNAYYWWQGGREGGQKSQKPAYVIHGCSLIVIWILVTSCCNEICKNSYCELMDDLAQSEYYHISCFHPDKKMCLKQWLKYTLQSLKKLKEVFFQTCQQQKQQLKLQ